VSKNNGIELQFLGLGAAFNPGMENTNAIFTAGEDFYILDCGETAFGKLWNLPALVSAPRITAAITHLHCDHTGSLASLISYCYYVLGKTIRVLHPIENIVSLLNLMGIEHSCYTWLPALEPECMEPVSFQAVEVEHVGNMTCYGYIISSENNRIWYSGDAKRIPPKIANAFLQGGIEKIYQDVSLEVGDHATHGSFTELEKMFPQEKRSHIYCMHLDKDYRGLIREKGFSVPKLLNG
jgi:ribonuclease BN (tRNA processing enzyme)